MSDDTRQRFDEAVAQAFPDGSGPSIDDIRERVKAGTISDGAASVAAAMTSPPSRGYIPSGFPSHIGREGAVYPEGTVWTESTDKHFAQQPPSRAYTADGRFTPEDIEAQQELLDSYKAQGRLWGPIRYADVQSLLDEVKASRASAPDAEHATMAEAVAAVTSASLTLARIEKKVDALGNPPRELANITPSWWLGASIGAIASGIAEAVRFANVETVHATRTMLAVACAHRTGMTLADLARAVEDAGRAPVIEIAGLADDVERLTMEAGMRATPDPFSPDDTPANRIRNVVGQLVTRLMATAP